MWRAIFSDSGDKYLFDDMDSAVAMIGESDGTVAEVTVCRATFIIWLENKVASNRSIFDTIPTELQLARVNALEEVLQEYKKQILKG
jgi:hypothetical protein